MKIDSVSQFLTQVRNAARARHKKVDVAASNLRISIAEIMKGAGFIRDYKLFRHENKGVLRLYFKYVNKSPTLHGIKRVSKLSRRVYRGYRDVSSLMGGIGITVLSTSKGVVTDQVARESHIGGEVICQIW